MKTFSFFFWRIRKHPVSLTKIIKTTISEMDNIGLIIKKLREEKGLPLRIVAAYLDIDQAILSKIEHGKRRAYREHIVKLAAFFNVQEEELLVAWLSDKIFHEVKDEKCALKAMQVAEEKVKSFAKNNR